MSSNAKPVKEKSKLGHLVKAFRKYYVPFIISIILLVASVVLTILTPGTIRSLTNEISPVGKTAIDGKFAVDFAKVTEYAIKLVIYVVGAFITNFISGYILNTIIQKFSKDIEETLLLKSIKLLLIILIQNKLVISSPLLLTMSIHSAHHYKTQLACSSTLALC